MRLRDCRFQTNATANSICICFWHGKRWELPQLETASLFRTFAARPSSTLAKPLVTLCFLERPIDFHASDARPVGVLFFSDSPTVQFHLALLSRLAFVLSDPELRAAIIRQAARQEILAQVQRVEDALVAQSAGKEPA